MPMCFTGLTKVGWIIPCPSSIGKLVTARPTTRNSSSGGAALPGGRPLIIGQDVERTVRAADKQNPPTQPNGCEVCLAAFVARHSGVVSGGTEAAVVRNEGNYATALEKVGIHRTPALQPHLPPTSTTKHRAKPPQSKSPCGCPMDITASGRLPKPKKKWMVARNYAIYRFKKGREN